VWHYPVECLTAINGVRFADAWTDSVSTTVDGLTVHVLSKPHLVASKAESTREVDINDLRELSRE
jgi:hypothetical protein